MQADETRRLVDSTNVSSGLGAKTPMHPQPATQYLAQSTSTPANPGAVVPLSSNSGASGSGLADEDSTIKPHTPMTNRYRELCRHDMRPTSSRMMTRSQTAREATSGSVQPHIRAEAGPEMTGAIPKRMSFVHTPDTPYPNLAGGKRLSQNIITNFTRNFHNCIFWFL